MPKKETNKKRSFVYDWEKDKASLERFVDYSLPVILAETTDELFNCLVTYEGKELTTLKIFYSAEKRQDDKPLTKTAIIIQQFLKRLMTVAFSENEILTEEEKEKLENLLNRKKVVVWEGLGNNVISYEAFSDDSDIEIELLREIERTIAVEITNLFASFYSNGQLQKKWGFDVVGVCPVCGKFFAKKRKNKEFCSEKCGSIARMRRLRGKKKK